MRDKVKKLHVSKNSSLILDDDCVLKDVEVDGHLEVKGMKEKNIEVKAKEKNYKQIIGIE